MSIVNYKLKRVKECEMYNEAGKINACWFYLTDSNYYLQLGDVKLFEYNSKFIKEFNLKSPYVDYYFSRLLEDIFEILQDIAYPIPYDLYKLIDTEEKQSVLDNKLMDWYYETENVNQKFSDFFEHHIEHEISKPDPNKESDFKLLGEKYLWLGYMCTSYLNPGFNCRFLHVENDLFIHYNCQVFDENCWTAKKGIFTIPFEEFVIEIELLLNNFFNDMDKQVSETINFLKEDEYSYTNFPPDYIKKYPESAPVKIGAEYLIEENENRKKGFFNILKEVREKSKVYQLYWNEVRPKLSLIK